MIRIIFVFHINIALKQKRTKKIIERTASSLFLEILFRPYLFVINIYSINVNQHYVYANIVFNFNSAYTQKYCGITMLLTVAARGFFVALLTNCLWKLHFNRHHFSNEKNFFPKLLRILMKHLFLLIFFCVLSQNVEIIW